MKRINPLLTANNPAPIAGCHAPVKAIAHSAVLYFSVPFSTLTCAISPTQGPVSASDTGRRPITARLDEICARNHSNSYFKFIYKQHVIFVHFRTLSFIFGRATTWLKFWEEFTDVVVRVSLQTTRAGWILISCWQ
jgi:hypothetical protein